MGRQMLQSITKSEDDAIESVCGGFKHIGKEFCMLEKGTSRLVGVVIKKRLVSYLEGLY